MAAVCVQRLGRGYLGRRAAQDRRDELEAARQMEEQLEKWNREEDRKERLAEAKVRACHSPGSGRGGVAVMRCRVISC